jgi:hypothetical protein
MDSSEAVRGYCRCVTVSLFELLNRYVGGYEYSPR